MSKHILLTGGGTAGHVTPNIALLPKLKEAGYKISYVGTYDGIEKELIEAQGIDYYSISSGKLRRQLTFKNFTDSFRVLKGIKQARSLIKILQPDIVFSKGGFVTVPVVLAAKSASLPIIIHESDLTPGLANRICIPRANIVCCNFEKTMKFIPIKKARLTGIPIRKELFLGDKKRGYEYTGLNNAKPIILIMGGSLGAMALNNVIHNGLDNLLVKYNIVHICGKGKLNTSLNDREGYVQYEYVGDELSDIMAMADLCISRAGANAISELLALKKLNILVPLSRAASRGDQILNAEEFRLLGYSHVIEEDSFDLDSLNLGLDKVFKEKEKYMSAMNEAKAKSSIEEFIAMFDSFIESN